MSTYDVVIIGGGISGLFCASQLIREGQFAVLVIEARDRLGGRLLSPFGVDLGASWVLGPRTESLAKRLGLSIIKQRDGANTPGGGAPRIRGGYAQMAESLAKEIGEDRIKSGCQANAITVSDASLEVSCKQFSGTDETSSSFSVRARRVVVALPPAVLSSSISFDPPLPAQQLERMSNTATWCGDWCKIIAVYKEPFWRKRGISSTVQPRQGPITVWWEGAAGSEEDEEVSALIGIAFGSEASAVVAALGASVEEESPDLRAYVIDSLGEIFGPVAKDLITTRSMCWITEPLTYAASVGKPGIGYGHRLLRQQTDNGLHFAGTESESMHGTVEGAIEAGNRVVAEILAAI